MINPPIVLAFVLAVAQRQLRGSASHQIQRSVGGRGNRPRVALQGAVDLGVDAGSTVSSAEFRESDEATSDGSKDIPITAPLAVVATAGWFDNSGAMRPIERRAMAMQLSRSGAHPRRKWGRRRTV